MFSYRSAQTAIVQSYMLQPLTYVDLALEHLEGLGIAFETMLDYLLG
jgi:hypothetical protein